MKYINPYKLFAGAFIPRWLAQRTELSQGAKLAYAFLTYHARASGWAKPGQEVLSEELGVGVRQVRSYIEELAFFKLIEVVQPGMHQTNRYRFLNHDWMHHAVEENPDFEPSALRRTEEYSAS